MTETALDEVHESMASCLRGLRFVHCHVTRNDEGHPYISINRIGRMETLSWISLDHDGQPYDGYGDQDLIQALERDELEKINKTLLSNGGRLPCEWPDTDDWDLDHDPS